MAFLRRKMSNQASEVRPREEVPGLLQALFEFACGAFSALPDCFEARHSSRRATGRFLLATLCLRLLRKFFQPCSRKRLHLLQAIPLLRLMFLCKLLLLLCLHLRLMSLFQTPSQGMLCLWLPLSLVRL